MSRLLLLGIGGPATVAVWTPAQPTTGGGVLPHTWFYAGQAQKWETSAKATLATDDGDPIGAMTNQGSDGYDVLQATSLLRPTLKLNIVNSNPVLRCDGGDWLRGVFVGGIVNQPLTIFAVAALSAANTGATRFVVDGDDITNRTALYERGTSTPDAWSIFSGVELIGGASDTNWDIWTALFNGASSQFWHNGISEASGNAGATGIDGITIAGVYVAAPANNWAGDVAEVLIYFGNLSTADKNQVGQYLATKYNISYTAIP